MDVHYCAISYVQSIPISSYYPSSLLFLSHTLSLSPSQSLYIPPSLLQCNLLLNASLPDFHGNSRLMHHQIKKSDEGSYFSCSRNQFCAIKDVLKQRGKHKRRVETKSYDDFTNILQLIRWWLNIYIFVRDSGTETALARRFRLHTHSSFTIVLTKYALSLTF